MATVFQQCKTNKQSKLYPCEKTRCGHDWTVRYREPGGRSGRQRETSFPTKKEAEAHGIKMENDKRSGVYIDPEAGRLPVRVWADQWLAQHVVTEGTRRVYDGFFRNYLIPFMGHKTIAGVTSADVKRLQADMVNGGLMASTVNVRLNCLRTMMRTAVLEKRIAENPCDGVKPLKTSTAAVDPDEIPTLVEVKAIAEAMTEPFRLTIWLMAGAGLRIGEALGFSSDCSRSGFLRIRRQISTQSVSGGSKAALAPLKHRTADQYRDIPTAPFLVAEIEAHIESGSTLSVEGLELLFSGTRGGMPSASTFAYQWKKALKGAGLDSSGYTPHSLRHFFASVALAGGVPLLEVSRWLGHQSIKVTADTYGHLTAEAPERCRQVMQDALRPSSGAGEDAARAPRAESVLTQPGQSESDESKKPRLRRSGPRDPLVVADDLGDDEVEELLGEGRVEPGVLGQVAQPLDLVPLAGRIGRRQPVLRLQPPDLLGALEALGQHVDDRGVDVVDAAPQSEQLRLGLLVHLATRGTAAFGHALPLSGGRLPGRSPGGPRIPIRSFPPDHVISSTSAGAASSVG